MALGKNRRTAEKSARGEGFALIPDATLVELHRRLLKAVAAKSRVDGTRRRMEGMNRYAAANVAAGFDLKHGDAILQDGAPRLRDGLLSALMHKTRKNGRIALVWGGEPGAEWQDALEAARAHALPIVFVCGADDARAARKLLPRVHNTLKPGEEMPSITVDGHDVVAAYRVAHEAIERARRDRGPTLILLTTYRIGGRAYTDAVADMDRYLRGRGLLNSQPAGTRKRALGRT